MLRYLRLTELRTDQAVLAKYSVPSVQDPRRTEHFADDFMAIPSRDVEGHMVVPSRDVSAAWATDMLSPGCYTRAGRPSDTTPAGEPTWYRHQHRRILTLAKSAELSEALRDRELKLSPSAFQTISAVTGGAAGATLASLSGVSVGAQQLCAAALLGWIAVRWYLGAYDHGLRLYRKVVLWGSVDDSSIHDTSPTETSALIDEWTAEYDATEALWQAENSTFYRQSIADLKEGKQVAGGTPTEVEEARLRNGLSTEAGVVGMARLTAGMASQAKFNRRILAMGPNIINEQWINRAVERYETFLQIAVRMHGISFSNFFS